MKFVTIDQLRVQCAADLGGADDAQLTVYANAAEQTVQRMANRAIFLDATERNAAITALPASVAAAYTTYDAAIAAAAGASDPRNVTYQTQLANTALNRALNDAEAIEHSIVIEDDIVEAILLLAGHWWRNREEVETGSGAAAVQVPQAAEHIMERYRYLGPL